MTEASFFKDIYIDKELEEKLNLFQIPIQGKSKKHSKFVFFIQDSKLTIIFNGENELVSNVDFTSAQKNWLIESSLNSNQIFKKALGLNKGFKSVIDVTAGWGQDSIVMHELGMCVTAVEREPIIYLLLWDGLRRYFNFYKSEGNKTVFNTEKEKFTLIYGDAISVLESLGESECPDLIYLDPMFPENKKRALSNKNMQILQALTDKKENNIEKLLKVALNKIKKRLILKRPLKDKTLDEKFESKKSTQFMGKSIRYDVYSK